MTDQNKGTIYLGNHGFKIMKHSHILAGTNKIKYATTKRVISISDYIFFSFDNSVAMYRTKQHGTHTYNGTSNFVVAIYDNCMYELYYKGTHNKLFVLDLPSDNYLSHNSNTLAKTIEDAIQLRRGRTIDLTNIVYPVVIYDYCWPNYTIVRNAYCDIIIEAVE